MMVMPANNAGIHMGYLVGKYPGLLGHLNSPGSLKGPFKWLPYALDNGKFSCWSGGKSWDADAFIGLCDGAKLSGQRPLWVLVPDEVANAAETTRLWNEWSPVLTKYGWPLAFAAQDGHTPADVPINASVVFIGGSTDWKIKNAAAFCRTFSRVHVGRVNELKWLRYYQSWGAESCDGTGWFRGDKRQLQGLEIFLEEMTHGKRQRHCPIRFPRRESRSAGA
jgi:hypothetical protein